MQQQLLRLAHKRLSSSLLRSNPPKTYSFPKPLPSLLQTNPIRSLHNGVSCKINASSPPTAAQAMVQELPMTDDFISTTLAKPSIFSQFTASYCFSFGLSGIPKAEKQAPNTKLDSYTYTSMGAGEDSYFCRHDSMGIADGVGGWSFHDGNSAFYSRKLMHYAQTELEKFDDIDADEFSRHHLTDPVEVLSASYDKTNFDCFIEQVKGSTTACIAVLRGDELRVANLGDCGLVIIRNGEYVFQTEEQQHSFNFPYQLGIVSGDRPTDAQNFQIKVKKGDVVIMGTDGLFDNLFEEEVLQIVRDNTTSHPMPNGQVRVQLNPQAISDALASRARKVAEDPNTIDTPFQTKAVNEGLYYSGGKMDDISVVTGVIWDFEDSPDRR
jgi:serine/threonine protein phosphatase PrpC